MDHGGGLAAHRAALSRNLRAHRAAAHLTQETLARRAGMSRQAYQAVETGQAWPRLDRLLLIADALGVTPADLLGDPH